MKKIIFLSFILITSLSRSATVTLNELVSNAQSTHEQADSLKDFRVVIPGVLYRGGNSGGGTQPLNAKGLKSLCEKGFSKAVYMYPDNFDRAAKPECELEYSTFGGTIKDRRLIYSYLAKIKDIIDNKKGPLYIHCWNGWHASGEMAAYALMQFCGVNGDQAQAYWNANVPNGSVTRIRSFKIFDDLMITAEQQSEICPK